MTNKTYLKQNIKLREEAEKNYAASTDSSNDSPSDIVNKTKAEHSDAEAVTIPGKEMDGSDNTQVTTIDVNNNPTDLQNAQRTARTLQSQGQDVNFKVKLKEGTTTENITFSKKELSRFLTKL